MILKAAQSLKKHGFQEFLVRAKGYMAWSCDKHLLHKRYATRQVYEYKMNLDLSDPGISTTLAKGILREKDQVFVVRRELKPGDVVLDIGANIGYYALMEASLIGPTGKVYAIEPVPTNMELLKKNIALNGFESIISTYQAAVSDTPKEEKFYLSAHSNLGSFHNTDYKTGERLSYMKDSFILVQTYDIAEFMKPIPRIDMIRMDIEGGEVEVFRGLLRALEGRSVKPKVLFETHRSRYDTEKHDLKAPLRALFEKGYYVKTLISNEEGVSWRDRGYKPERLIRTDGTTRGIYSTISNEDALEFICHLGGVRAVFLAPKS
jgi:FkbM family methyltransferase